MQLWQRRSIGITVYEAMRNEMKQTETTDMFYDYKYSMNMMNIYDLAELRVSQVIFSLDLIAFRILGVKGGTSVGERQ